MPEVKKRGRPPLSPAEREARRIAKNKQTVEWHKSTGYAAQKKYKESHPESRANERGRVYEPKIRIPMELKGNLESLMKETGLSITRLFVSAVEEKYGVVLHRDIDNRE